MRHARRLDRVLDRARAVDLDREIPLAPRLGQEIVQLLVETKDRGGACHQGMVIGAWTRRARLQKGTIPE
jgi:hypothetical protein